MAPQAVLMATSVATEALKALIPAAAVAFLAAATMTTSAARHLRWQGVHWAAAVATTSASRRGGRRGDPACTKLKCTSCPPDFSWAASTAWATTTPLPAASPGLHSAAAASWRRE